jgi:transcriptional regulator with PAS, ATPase and Fis domain
MSSRVVLVCSEQALGFAVGAQLKKTLGPNLLQHTPDSLRAELGRYKEAVLLFAVAGPAEAEQAFRLIQEICLQKLPPLLLVVTGDALAGNKHLESLAPFVARRLSWPGDAARLAQLLHDRIGRAAEVSFPASPESIEQVISRRLLSQTPSLFPLVERIAIAATHDVTVLLTGETGTGKTFLARLMHDGSPRKGDPFVSVPCGAQPANLVESAFFGHVRGAFTGADRTKAGKFEAAGKGTILLDEIDTLGLEQQASLLRVIETGEYEPVGSNETHLCKARIIVASNWDLEDAVRRKAFREDLYYRLNVMSFHLPPLRERVQDIAPLARAMTARFTTKFRKDLFDISPQALDAIESYPWPGNIRQLENFVQQAVLVSSGPELLLEHLPAQVRDYRPAQRQAAPVVAVDSLIRNREQLERNVIQRALANNGYSRSRAANALGISRVTLYKKMKKYNLMSSPVNPSNP